MTSRGPRRERGSRYCDDAWRRGRG